jgi:general secretion pathway protein A
MTAHPFSERIPTDAIFRDERMTQGTARLDFMKHHATVALITGDEGVGKSTLIRLFMDSLHRNRYHPVYIHLTHLNAPSLLKLLVSAMDELPAWAKHKVFLQILNKTKSKDITTIVLIDEAHLLAPDALIDLRLLLSSAIDDSDSLKIVLIGHSEIKKELSRSCHTALLQRITVRYHITPLTLSQTHQYMDFHMRRVGCSEKIFETEVKNDIHDYARGIPRLINNLATACLLNAAVNNCQKVNTAVLLQILDEFQIF